MSAAKNRRQSSRFTVGGEQAEADPLLKDSFYATAHYDALSSRDDMRCFVIGRTGSGKSAILQRLVEERPGHVIRISPDDLSLPYVADMGTVKQLAENDVHLSPFFIALWKHVFLVEIIRHRYSIDSLAAKQNFLSNLYSRISQDRSKLAALEYLNEFGDRFWCETDERVREITERFEQRVSAETSVGGAALLLKSGLSSDGIRSTEHRAEIVARCQRVVNDTQLPRLNKMMAVLDEDILDTEQHFTYIVIDDLDRDFADDSIANDLILCLFRAVVDLKRVRNLKIIVALRTNIFQALDFGKGGGQEEKFRALTMRLRWTPQEIAEMLDERVGVAAKKTGNNEISCLQHILPNRNPRRGSALDVMLKRTMLRPRDAITFVNACLDVTAGRPKITWEDINAAEPQYSHNRMLALRDEWRASFPGLDRVFGVFAGAPGVISPQRFKELLDEVAMLLADSTFVGITWLMESTKQVWTSDDVGDGNDLRPFRPLIELLYDIGFIGLRQASPRAIFSQEFPEFLTQHHAFGSIAGFVVHPAFWATLGITARDDV